MCQQVDRNGRYFAVGILAKIFRIGLQTCFFGYAQEYVGLQDVLIRIPVRCIVRSRCGTTDVRCRQTRWNGVQFDHQQSKAFDIRSPLRQVFAKGCLYISIRKPFPERSKSSCRRADAMISGYSWLIPDAIVIQKRPDI